MKTLNSKVYRLENLIEHQDGSVVSREVISKKTGTVSIFAFDKGEGLSEHTAPFDALVICLDGVVQVTIEGHPYRLNNGDMIIMPAGKPHALKAEEKLKMLLV